MFSTQEKDLDRTDYPAEKQRYLESLSSCLSFAPCSSRLLAQSVYLTQSASLNFFGCECLFSAVWIVFGCDD